MDPADHERHLTQGMTTGGGAACRFAQEEAGAGGVPAAHEYTADNLGRLRADALQRAQLLGPGAGAADIVAWYRHRQAALQAPPSPPFFPRPAPLPSRSRTRLQPTAEQLNGCEAERRRAAAFMRSCARVLSWSLGGFCSLDRVEVAGARRVRLSNLM